MPTHSGLAVTEQIQILGYTALIARVDMFAFSLVDQLTSAREGKWLRGK